MFLNSQLVIKTPLKTIVTKPLIYSCKLQYYETHFIDSLTELPECRLGIASNKDILHQISCVSIAPDLGSFPARRVATLLSNLASTPEAHQYIADSVYIRHLLHACEKFKLIEPENVTLLE